MCVFIRRNKINKNIHLDSIYWSVFQVDSVNQTSFQKCGEKCSVKTDIQAVAEAVVRKMEEKETIKKISTGGIFLIKIRG